MALPIASVVVPTGGVVLRFEAEPQEICQHYLSKIALSPQDRRKRRYFFILYVRSLRNFRKETRDGVMVSMRMAWGCCLHIRFQRLSQGCTSGRGYTVPRFVYEFASPRELYGLRIGWK